LWQTIAVQGVLDICSDLLPGARAKHDDPKRIDLVSKVIRFASEVIHSGNTVVKLALLVHPALILFRIVGNATITVSDGSIYEQPLPIGSIATFSLNLNSTDVTSQAVLESIAETDMIVRLEQVYGTAWGYISKPNYLIPLPIHPLKASQVIYETDVAHFHHDCRWDAPDSYSSDIIKIGNNTWTAGMSSNMTAVSDSRIVGTY
jgi:hypothetical protein